MDAATFDRFLVLLDKHWSDPQHSAQTAAELHEWREAEARRLGQPSPMHRITGANLGALCRKALTRLSDPYFFPFNMTKN
jgi:hypothetical protein